MAEAQKTIDVAWGRLSFLVGSLVLSIVIGWFFQPLVSDNTDAINTIVTIFSILAGFLIAVITFIAEPVLTGKKNWDELQLAKPTIKRKLMRQQFLFFLYLVTLGLALAMFLTPDSQTLILLWLERFFLSLAVFIFIMSFTLPGSLRQIQLERFEAQQNESAPDELRS